MRRLADLAGAKRKCGVRRGRLQDRGFRDQAEFVVGRFQAALLGEILERQSGSDAAARGLRFVHAGKDDLRYFALLGRAELVLALVENLPRLFVGDFAPFADFVRRDHGERQFSVFGRAELGLAFVEIGGERFRRRRIDGAGLGGVELDVVDRALLVLETGQRVDQQLWRLKPGRDGAGDLPAQRHPPLFGEIALFGVAELPDRSLKTSRVELAANALEVRIVVDHAHDLGLGQAEPHPPRFFIERRIRNGLLQHLAVEAEGARLLLRQRPAELAADLLQPVGVDLAELVRRDLGAADLGQRRLPKPLEDVGDAPDAETDDQDAHHHGHDNLAEPV